jgi:hypothetical protein
MKSIRSSSLFPMLILAAGLIAAVATPASAQAAHGSFTLAHEARWGGMVLAPGSYSFSLQSPGRPATLTLRNIKGDMAFVIPSDVSTKEPADTSRLVLSRGQDGKSYVSALYLEDLGLVLHYRLPKPQMIETATARPDPVADSQAGR